MPSGSPRRSLMPHTYAPQPKKTARVANGILKTTLPIVLPALVLGLSLFSLPSIIATDSRSEQLASIDSTPFPVSVDPTTKTIVENPTADLLLKRDQSARLSAAAWSAKEVFVWIANTIASLPFYQYLGGADVQFVVVQPGYRQEEVAQAFANTLGWSTAQKKAFLKGVATVAPTLSEGEFVPGTYEVHPAMSPKDVQALLAERFANQILARYTSDISSQVPLKDALTIASLIERETGGTDDMRMISGIIWNRLFSNMNLQIDATLQYAKSAKTKSWWPQVLPNDKYISSAYNTYAHKGLPPGPIASPSIATVIAALNPKPTDCIFYFHDKKGEFHCSATYKEHVALLKKYYGQGK